MNRLDKYIRYSEKQFASDEITILFFDHFITQFKLQ